MEKLLISACLLGQKVRYDGRVLPAQGDGLIRRWQEEGRLVPFCPEVAGGLPVPRPAAEIQGGDGSDVISGEVHVATVSSIKVSAHFISGAQQALETCRKQGITLAVLKERSPSCGVHLIHDGSFSGRTRAGQGVTTATLRQAGIEVFSENELDLIDECLRGIRTCVS